jgi:hypothetical protein
MLGAAPEFSIKEAVVLQFVLPNHLPAHLNLRLSAFVFRLQPSFCLSVVSITFENVTP